MRIAAVLFLALAACGGASSDLEGIYTVDAWNENPASCADPGPSTLANHDPLVFVQIESFFGQDFLAMQECTDPAACTTEANSESPHLFPAFDQGNDDDGWTGSIAFSTGPDVDNNCSGSATFHTLTKDGDTAFTVRFETRDVTFAPTDGECPADDVADLARDQPCTELEVMHATFSAEL
jgi:hypothetical protein